MSNPTKDTIATRLLKKKPDPNQPDDETTRNAAEEDDIEQQKQGTSSSSEDDSESGNEQTNAGAPSRSKSPKTSSKKEEKEKFYTYMSADNYEEFEEMFIFVRKAISKKMGKKLKVTNMAELAIVLAKKQLFDKDRKGFLALIEEELEGE